MINAIIYRCTLTLSLTDLGIILKPKPQPYTLNLNGWQLAKMKKSIPDMSLP